MAGSIEAADGVVRSDQIPESPVRSIVVHGATPVAHEPPDRLAWRVRVKAHPVLRAWFRVGVAVLGSAMIIAAPLAGWLPGPGGIPLFLMGLALLATEFLWAKRLHKYLLRRLRVYLSWPASRQRLFWAGFFACLAVLQYCYLCLSGVPGWLPGWAARWLRMMHWVN